MKAARHICHAITIIAPLLWVSCEDASLPNDKKNSVHAPQLEQVSAAALQEGMEKLLEAYPQVELASEGSSIQPAIVQQDGSQLILAEVPVRITERLLKLEKTPQLLNKLRKASNEAINAAVRPDSGYLMQVGAPTEVLIDEDRQAKPLPAELDGIAKKLKAMAEESVYLITYEQDSIVKLEAKIRLVQSPSNAWVISDVDIDDRPLREIQNSVRSAAQDAQYAILTPEWLEKRKAAISTLCEQFKQLAAPYIEQREEMARKLLVERISLFEENRRAVIERATFEEAERLARKQRIAALFEQGCLYRGEWTRDQQFGKLTLQIDKAELMDESIQFVGSIYDTDLPEARLNISGRCNLSDTENGTPVNITIYDGQYDPDEPTAEVYDAKDGALILKLDENDKLIGIMSCLSWGEDSERNFIIKLSPEVNTP